MSSCWPKLLTWLENKKAITGLLLFLMAFSYFGWLAWQPSFADPDSFYHIKISQLMAHGQLVIKDFPWLQQTTLNGNYIDQHFLYHLLMIPFVKYLPPLIGAKLFQTILASLMLLTFYYLLKRIKIKGAFWWSLSLLLSQAFVFRMSLVKAQPFALILFFLSLLLIIKKRPWLLVLLAPIYVWSYGGWFFLPVLAIVYALVELWETGKAAPILKKIRAFFQWDNLKLFSAVILGILIGLIANPYFPKNLRFYYEQIVQIGLINFQKHVMVGSEWYPVDPLVFLKTNWFCLLLIIFSVILFWEYKNQLSKQEKYFFILLCLFILGTAKAKRNVEYLIPITTLFAAAIFHQASRIPKMKADLTIIANKIKIFFFGNSRMKYFFTAIFILSAVFVLISLASGTKKFLVGYPTFQKSSEFLARTVPPGETIFNASWSFFPMYFYYNDKNYYLIGMDPTFMYLKNPLKYKEWSNISSGKDQLDLAAKIKTDFQSDYIICSKISTENQGLISALNNNPDFVKLYEDEEGVIYRIK